jgi:hypothetical protein
LRKSAWIPIALLLVGALLVGRGLVESGPVHQTRAAAAGTSQARATAADRAPGGRPEATPATAARAGASAPDPSGPRIPDTAASTLVEAHASPSQVDAERSPAERLDLASEAEIQRTLDAAIERERRRRPLYVAPGIVDRVAAERRVRVIFDWHGAGLDRAGALLAGPTGDAAVEGLRVFPLLGHAAARLGPEALLQLIRHEGTARLELDGLHRTSLEQTIPIIGADVAHQLGHDGDGTAIVILDTGVDPTHPMYADRLIDEACFSAGNDCPNGLSEMFGPGAAIPCAIGGCGHGTRVAGIALGEEPGGSLVGVAPHADLIAIQIFSEVSGEPAAYASDILAGLQHVLALSAIYPIAAVNLSLGGSVFTSEASCDLAVASQRLAVGLLRDAGILTVAASGNEFFTNALTTPACLSNVIGVGSTSDDDVVSAYSNSASFLRMLAPGENVESSRLGGGTSISSGTSMASAHVAGAIATIREAVPAATADEIDNALALSGLPVFDTRNGVTTPRLRVAEAIDLLDAGAGGGGSTPAATEESSGGGGGGGCGLVGIEPLLVLGLVRLGRRRRVPRDARRGPPGDPAV